MILKIQISLETTHSEPQVLIYNANHEIEIEAPLKLFRGLAEKMGDQKRAFFEARVYAIDDQGGVSISLDEQQPEQGW